ncbi:MAG: hypothetical protein VKM34_01220 [Cyanobacteriota bacterium]|nr:hypothetical protein [Cyanobacteriota bacterium]
MVDPLHVAAKSHDLSGVERDLIRQLRSGAISLIALRDHQGQRAPRVLSAQPNSCSRNTN